MTTDERRRVIPLAIRAALASVATALVLLVLKSYAAWHTGSVAMLASLADTGLDLLASLVTLYGVKLAAEPADSDHRFRARQGGIAGGALSGRSDHRVRRRHRLARDRGTGRACADA